MTSHARLQASVALSIQTSFSCSLASSHEVLSCNIKGLTLPALFATHSLAVSFSPRAFLETPATQATKQLRLILMLMSPFWSGYTNMASNWLGESVLIVQKLQLVAISREKKCFVLHCVLFYCVCPVLNSF